MLMTSNHPQTPTTAAVHPRSGVRLWVIGFLLLAAASGGYYYWTKRAGAEPRPVQRGRFGPFGGPNQATPVRVVSVQHGARQNP